MPLERKPLSSIARQKDGTQPPLPSAKPEEPKQKPGTSPARRPPPPLGVGQSRVPPQTPGAGPRRPPSPMGAPPPTTMGPSNFAEDAAHVLRGKYGLREDDPIFALLAVLVQFEKQVATFGSTLTRSLVEKLELSDAKFKDFREAVADAEPLKDEIGMLAASLEEAKEKIEQLQALQGDLDALAKRITQTGHADRLLRILAPAIAGAGGVAIGFILAAAVFLFDK